MFVLWFCEIKYFAPASIYSQNQLEQTYAPFHSPFIRHSFPQPIGSEHLHPRLGVARFAAAHAGLVDRCQIRHFYRLGVYSVPAFTTKGNYAEWYQNSVETNAHKGKDRAFHEANFGDRSYYDLADDFHAELYNPDEWARLFERAGAKYAVFDLQTPRWILPLAQ